MLGGGGCVRSRLWGQWRFGDYVAPLRGDTYYLWVITLRARVFDFLDHFLHIFFRKA